MKLSAAQAQMMLYYLQEFVNGTSYNLSGQTLVAVGPEHLEAAHKLCIQIVNQQDHTIRELEDVDKD